MSAKKKYKFDIVAMQGTNQMGNDRDDDSENRVFGNWFFVIRK